MKLVFKRDEFLKALEYCNSSIEKKNTMPILGSVLINCKEGVCKLTATNLDTSVIVTVSPVEQDGEGSYTVPARKIFEVCRVIRGETIHLLYNAEHSLLEIVSGTSKYHIPCPNKDDFPIVNEEKGNQVEIMIGKLISHYKKIQFSMTDTSINKAYSGVLIKRIKSSSGDKIELVTTDIHRISVLSLKNLGFDIESIDEGIVISGKNFIELTKIFDNVESVKAWTVDGKLTLSSDNVTFITRLMKNEFPNYRTITEAIDVNDQKDRAVINRKELIDGIRRATVLMSDEKIMATKFEFKGNILAMSAHADLGGTSSDEIVVEKPLEQDKHIGINARYLLDVITVLDTDSANLIVKEGLKPLTILEDTEDYFYIHMIMPLRI